MDSPDFKCVAGGMSLNTLILSRYDRLGASSRLRTMQFLPYLKWAGLQTEVAPLFSDEYLINLYEGKKIGNAVVRAYHRRLFKMRASRCADLIWIEKEALPWVPWWLERALLPPGVPIVTDFDDAVFHRYDLHRSALVKQILGKKIDSVMAGSALVIAGNRYLAERARAAGSPWVEVVPTVVDVDHYKVRPQPDLSKPATLGWIGSPSTWQEYLLPMMSMLTKVANSASARIILVGAGANAADNPLVDAVPWTEDTEVARIQDMDIGIMPLPDTLWARGKCGYKLIQYMACGLPVVASPVGVNSEIVEHGVNGFLAETDEEWQKALKILLSSPELRQRMGAAGRKKVEEMYSLQVQGPRLARLLAEVAGKKTP